MEYEVASRYKSASQRARVVTELWGAGNLYCPDCDSPASVLPDLIPRRLILVVQSACLFFN